MAKVKVAVLGGGVGGCVAAMRLTATQELRDRYEVTVYQPGFRLGGKGASGRNADEANRIEEHGLHMWFGFYDNAFREMRQAYVELDRDPQTHPLATLDDAFHGSDTVVVYDTEGKDEHWRGMPVKFPVNDTPDRPGGPTPYVGDGATLPTFWQILGLVNDVLVTQWAEQAKKYPGLAMPYMKLPLSPADMWLVPVLTSMDLGFKLLGTIIDAAEAGQPLPIAVPKQLKPEAAAAAVLRGLRDMIWSVVKDKHADDAHLRLIFTCTDIAAATVAGFAQDEVLDKGFEVLNQYELTEWLVANGVLEVTSGTTPAERSPALRAIYDLVFAYEDGDIDRPNAAAGTALNDVVRLLFTYRQHIGYKMQAGMGDAVFGPFYEVLANIRKVKFRFFHAATGFGVSSTGSGPPVVDSIQMVEQVQLANNAKKYNPLVTVEKLKCWPAEPRWNKLVAGAQLKASGIDFEYEVNPLNTTPKTLKRGVDFDEVVLAVSPGRLVQYFPDDAPGIADELVKHSKQFATAMKHVGLVRTQALQMWFTKDTAALGYPHGADSVAGTFTEPMDTYCDMTHLIPRESWPAGTVRSIAYFCGVLDHRAETHDQATARVRLTLDSFTEDHLDGIYPNVATQTGGGKKVDWSVFATSPKHKALGAKQKLSTQYWRANTHGTELYVLSKAGSIEHRLRSDDTGFANLVAAGDWTRNGVDGGCVEAAAISAVYAANAIVKRHLKPGEALPDPPTNATNDWLNKKAWY